MSGLDIEGVLAAHSFVTSGICTCGEDVGLTHRAHVAAALRQQINAALVTAWDEGATKASPHGGGYLRSLLIENPYWEVPS